MSYCIECGTKLEAQVKFCPECGAPVEQKIEPANAPAAAAPTPVVEPAAATPSPVVEPANIPAYVPAQSLPEQEAKIEWKKGAGSFLSWIKRRKWIVIGVLAFVVILGGLYATGAYLTDGNRLVAKFEKALKDGDAETLASMLQPGEKSLVVDKDSVKPLLDYLKDDTFNRAAVAEDLRAQVKLYKQKKDAMLAMGSYDDSIVKVKKTGKRLLFYNDYALVVTPFYPYVTTTYAGTKITVNGKELVTSKEEYYGDKVGPVMPGKHTFKAKYTGDYASMEAEKTLTLSDPIAYYDVDLDLDGNYIRIASNYEDAAIFIDGKDTGLTHGDYADIGPILVDGSSEAYVEKEFPWGVVKSEVFPIDTDYIQADLEPENEDFRESVKSATQSFFQELATALSSQDTSSASHMSGEVKQAVDYLIQEMQAQNIVYDGKVIKVVFDMSSIELLEWGEDLRANVSVQAHFSQSFSLSEDPSNSASEDTIFNQACELTYKDGQWIVTDFYDEYYFNDADTEELMM
ncbi:zinc-ribbon domain-containing protein [Paenibacillus sp. FSL R5-0407]|uniref:zinc ribbon domain-containing protein n=1 Tax=Paenibacillus sp. FSL R5-0407 TaxID=2975320 RepID=UPI0030FCF964